MVKGVGGVRVVAYVLASNRPVLIVHLLHPSFPHLIIALPFQLVVHVAHMAEIFPNALDASEQGPTAVHMRVSGASRGHNQIVLLFVLHTLSGRSKPLLIHLDVVETHGLLCWFALFYIEELAMTFCFLA